MQIISVRGVLAAMAVAVGAATFCLSANTARAATEYNYGSGVQAYFGSQSNAYFDSDPFVGAFALPSAPPVGGYPVGLVITSSPPQPSPIVFPAWVGNPFSGAASVSSFSDSSLPTPPATTTTSVSKIVDNYSTSPLLTEDTSIQITNWTFNQPLGATGFAFAELNFSSSYVINGAGLGGSTPTFTRTISGNVNSTSANPGFFQYDEVVDYWWIPSTATINTAGLTYPVPSGTPQYLGSLSYAYYQATGGPFSTTLVSSGTLAATPAGYGVLELDGHAWVAGDPFQIEITPEPTSLSLLALGGLAILRRPRRR